MQNGHADYIMFEIRISVVEYFYNSCHDSNVGALASSSCGCFCDFGNTNLNINWCSSDHMERKVPKYFPSIPFTTPWWHHSKTLVMPSTLCAHIHSLSSDWERRPYPSKHFDFVSVCVFVCQSTMNSSIFGKNSLFPFPYLVQLIII